MTDQSDRLERENAHLRVIAQKVGCLYGHRTESGCDLGYPGCVCMDDLLAMQAWGPEDEEKAAVRLGKRIARLEMNTELLTEEELFHVDYSIRQMIKKRERELAKGHADAQQKLDILRSAKKKLERKQ